MEIPLQTEQLITDLRTRLKNGLMKVLNGTKVHIPPQEIEVKKVRICDVVKPKNLWEKFEIPQLGDFVLDWKGIQYLTISDTDDWFKLSPREVGQVMDRRVSSTDDGQGVIEIRVLWKNKKEEIITFSDKYDGKYRVDKEILLVNQLGQFDVKNLSVSVSNRIKTFFGVKRNPEHGRRKQRIKEAVVPVFILGLGDMLREISNKYYSINSLFDSYNLPTGLSSELSSFEHKIFIDIVKRRFKPQDINVRKLSEGDVYINTSLLNRMLRVGYSMFKVDNVSNLRPTNGASLSLRQLMLHENCREHYFNAGEAPKRIITRLRGIHITESEYLEILKVVRARGDKIREELNKMKSEHPNIKGILEDYSNTSQAIELSKS